MKEENASTTAISGDIPGFQVTGSQVNAVLLYFIHIFVSRDKNHYKQRPTLNFFLKYKNMLHIYDIQIFLVNPLDYN